MKKLKITQLPNLDVENLVQTGNELQIYLNEINKVPEIKND